MQAAPLKTAPTGASRTLPPEREEREGIRARETAASAAPNRARLKEREEGVHTLLLYYTILSYSILHSISDKH